MYELSIYDLRVVSGGSGGKTAQGAITGMGAYAGVQIVKEQEVTVSGLAGSAFAGAIGSSTTNSAMFGAMGGAAIERGVDYIGNQLNSNPVNLGPGFMVQPDSTMPLLMQQDGTNYDNFAQDKSGNSYGG